MRRRRLACLALAATVSVVTACDTDDGRELQTPESYLRFRLESSTTSTSTTVAPPPTEFVPVSPSTAPTTSSSSTTTTTTASSSTAAPVSSGGSTAQVSAPTSPGSAVSAAQLQFAGPWDDGAAIPVEFTCDGAGDVPLITWTAPPEGTTELALSVVDPDADGFVHWLVIGLAAEAGSVGGGEPIVSGATEAANSFANPGWAGPCPPPGDAPHTYQFTLHLLDQVIELPADTPTSDLITAVEAATGESTTFTGTYERA